MNWQDVIDKAKAIITGGPEKVAGILSWVERGRTAFDQGTVLASELIEAVKYFDEQYDTVKSTDFRGLLDKVMKGQGENTYTNLVASLTTDELLELHRSSVLQLRIAANKKLRELEVLRSLIELPIKLKSIIAILA